MRVRSFTKDKIPYDFRFIFLRTLKLKMVLWFGLRKQLKELENKTSTSFESMELEIEKLRELTITNTTQRSLNSLQKKVLRKLDLIKLQKAIYNFVREGYKTNRMKEEIKLMFNISNTCFYKYLKLVREQLQKEVVQK